MHFTRLDIATCARTANKNFVSRLVLAPVKLYLQDVLMVVEHGHETLVFHGINKMLSILLVIFVFFILVCPRGLQTLYNRIVRPVHGNL